MKQEILFTLDTPYRQQLEVEAFRFGEGEKTCAIVGALRGNEIQQVYLCGQIVKALKRLEEKGGIRPGKEILVVPCVNHFSMNVGSRFWPMDHTDINRMFPGYDAGETTQRIADALFRAVQGYRYGIQTASFYLPGDFIPHIRLMETGYEAKPEAMLFGMPYVVMHKPQPFDTTMLSYNWQIWDTMAFSVYTTETDEIDEASAQDAVLSVFRFLRELEVIDCDCPPGFISQFVEEETMENVLTPQGGIFRRLRRPGDRVLEGDVLAEILNPLTGEIKALLKSPCDGVVFFAAKNPLTPQHTVAFRIIRNQLV